ncbi:LLM class flavin-dependent oxidoreductase [Lysinibacillus sp. KU-BSD001]|uniref:LLM class flavin-dependent oxidoreductase n=1 Tax=Lysinibacillus sp. KU-BSD001 TaxID=3141328 RepID=UPI0036E626C9
MEKLKLPISVLDLVPVLEGQTAHEAFIRARDLAQHVDALGYNRYWLAEHHNSRAIASSATAVGIGYIAEATKHIRVGSGGVMLPNHVPLIVAEQFGTLNAMYPGRIDLGLGRAPGTDPFTARALRRNIAGEDFEENLLELQHYLSDAKETDTICAYPGFGDNIPMWILGSSLFSAELAARRGLPYAFASHFAPDFLTRAIKLYREQFTPSEYCEKPYVLACVNAIVADTDEEAHYLATTFYQFFLSIIRRDHQLLKPPVENMDAIWSPFERDAVMQQRQYTYIGSKETVAKQLKLFIEETGVDEIMFSASIFDNEERKHSFTCLREIFD